MALLFADGGDWAADSTSAKARWTDVSSGITVSASGSHYSTQNYILSGLTSSITTGLVTAVTSSTHILFQGWIKLAVNAAFTVDNNVILINLLNGGTSAAQIKYNPHGDVLQLIGSAGAQKGTNDTGSNLNDGEWHWVEWKILIASTAVGTSEFRVDNVARSNLTVTSTAFNSTAATQLQLGSNHRTATEYFNLHFDDVCIWDWNSGQVTDFTGKCRITTLLPNSDSAVTWTPDTGATNYTQVSKSQYSVTHNLQTLTLNNQDLYGHVSFAGYGFTPATLRAMQTGFVGILASGTSANVAAVLKSSSTTDVAAGVSVSATPTYAGKFYETDPATSAAWTYVNANAALIGIKLTATTSSGKAEAGIVFVESIGSDLAGSIQTTDTITSAALALTLEPVIGNATHRNAVTFAALSLLSTSVAQKITEPVTLKTMALTLEKVGQGWRNHIATGYLTVAGAWHSPRPDTNDTVTNRKASKRMSGLQLNMYKHTTGNNDKVNSKAYVPLLFGKYPNQM